MFSSLKMLGTYLGLGVPLGLVGIPWTVLTGDVSWLYWRTMGVVRLGVKAAGITVRVEGLEAVPAGRSCIFMSNHVSNLDPPVLMPLMPTRGVVMLKKELMGIPILGTAMRQGGFIPVERGAGSQGGREAAKSTVEAAAKAVAEGLHILVFPEGTRSPDGRLGRFKKGPFYLAEQTGALIVPVAIWGTERLMKKGSSAITPGQVQVRMLATIDPAGYGSREELIGAVRGAILGALPAEMRG